MRKLALYALLASWASVQFGCGKDDSPSNPDEGPTETFYNITQATINTDGYTAPGELSFWYSIDNGESYSIEKTEDLSKGDELWVKINNGEVDIFEEDFYFDWSGSSIAPADSESDLAKFVVKESDITLTVSVTDKLELLVSDRDTGQFFVLDITDGGLTPVFTILEGELALERVRGAIYNYNDGLLYLSTTRFSTVRSKLYAIDLATKQATLINDNNDENDEEVWKGISDLVVTPENLILATAGFALPNEPALLSFDTAGNPAPPMTFTGDDIPCCGLGLVYGDNASEVWIGSGLSDPVKIYKSSLTSNVSEVTSLTLEGFENTDSVSYFIRNLVKSDNEVIYALCYEAGSVNTHIAKVDLENNKLVHISQIGAGNQQRYNGLVAVPAYAF